MRTLLKNMTVEPLVEDLYLAKLPDEDDPLGSTIEAVFFLDRWDRAMIERIDQTIEGEILWDGFDDDLESHSPYIASRIEDYIRRNPKCLAKGVAA